MELFKRNPFTRTQREETTLEPAPVFPPVEASDSEAPSRNWPMLAALAIAALAFAVLVGVSATWLYHKLHKDSGPSNSVQSLPQPPPQDLTPKLP
jgi:hypothetical protein